MKILNLYAGLGGNRRLWGNEHYITAVEIDSKIASIYGDFFPNDKMVIGEAHQYLLDHYQEFDFIWSSPPCPSHSRARFWNASGGGIDAVYPDMSLYQEILLLTHYFKGKWAVENVKPFYTPLIKTDMYGRHLIWSNFHIGDFNKSQIFDKDSKDGLQKNYDFDLNAYKGVEKLKLLRNAVEPELGAHILEWAQKTYSPTKSLFQESPNKTT